MLTETANTGGGTDFWRKDGELLWTYQACKKTERERIIPLLMATHSSTLAWKIPWTEGAWWAAVYGVAQSRTRLKRLSSSKHILNKMLYTCNKRHVHNLYDSIGCNC